MKKANEQHKNYLKIRQLFCHIYYLVVASYNINKQIIDNQTFI
jgi:hypothetical protein